MGDSEGGREARGWHWQGVVKVSSVKAEEPWRLPGPDTEPEGPPFGVCVCVCSDDRPALIILRAPAGCTRRVREDSSLMKPTEW